jgi:hypothetical protein
MNTSTIRVAAEMIRRVPWLRGTIDGDCSLVRRSGPEHSGLEFLTLHSEVSESGLIFYNWQTIARDHDVHVVAKWAGARSG